jgi:hypothetical protein
MLAAELEGNAIYGNAWLIECRIYMKPACFAENLKSESGFSPSLVPTARSPQPTSRPSLFGTPGSLDGTTPESERARGVLGGRPDAATMPAP